MEAVDYGVCVDRSELLPWRRAREKLGGSVWGLHVSTAYLPLSQPTAPPASHMPAVPPPRGTPRGTLHFHCESVRLVTFTFTFTFPAPRMCCLKLLSCYLLH